MTFDTTACVVIHVYIVYAVLNPTHADRNPAFGERTHAQYVVASRSQPLALCETNYVAAQTGRLAGAARA